MDMSTNIEPKNPSAGQRNAQGADETAQNPALFQQVSEAEEGNRTAEAIRRGLEEMNRGEGQPLAEFDAEMRKKYGLPKRRP